MKIQVKLLEKRAEEIREKLDTVAGDELRALDEELAVIQDQILYEKVNLQADASYEDYLDYLGD